MILEGDSPSWGTLKNTNTDLKNKLKLVQVNSFKLGVFDRLTNSQNHRLTNSQTHRITNSQNHRITDSQNHRIT